MGNSQNCIPPKRPTHEPLPAPAVNAARRMTQLSREGDGHHTINLIVHSGTWLMIVDGGKLETLGKEKG